MVAASTSSSSKISESGRKVIVVPVGSSFAIAPTTSTSPRGAPRSNSWRCTLPSRRTSAARRSESALTTETPTPCSPPDTL